MTDGAIATTAPTTLANPQATFAELAAVADSTNSYAVIEKDDKPWLDGYPFIITSATFRDGTPRKIGPKKDDTAPTNYVSLELTLADAATRDKLKNAGKMTPGVYDKFEPNEHVVLNDGSTGIYRQICEYLERRGFITFPDGPANGPSGESRYDTYRTAWTFHANAGTDDAPRVEGFALLVKRGLRVSEYESDFSADGSKTYYLA